MSSRAKKLSVLGLAGAVLLPVATYVVMRKSSAITPPGETRWTRWR